MYAIKRMLDCFVGSAQSTAAQVPRALVVSGLAAALDFGTLLALVEGAGWQPVPAAILSYLLGGVVQYVLSSRWVFQAAPSSLPLGFAAFTLLSLVGLGITAATMALLHDLLGVYYPLAKTAALGLAFSWNFLSRKFWIFVPAAA